MLENVVIAVEEEPEEEDYVETDTPDDEELFGIYRGPMRTEIGFDGLPGLPPQVAVFRGPICVAAHRTGSDPRDPGHRPSRARPLLRARGRRDALLSGSALPRWPLPVVAALLAAAVVLGVRAAAWRKGGVPTLGLAPLDGDGRARGGRGGIANRPPSSTSPRFSPTRADGAIPSQFTAKSSIGFRTLRWPISGWPGAGRDWAVTERPRSIISWPAASTPRMGPPTTPSPSCFGKRANPPGPGNISALYQKYKLNRPVVGDGLLQAIDELKSGDPRALQLFREAVAEAEKGNAQKAIDLNLEVISISPDLVQAYMNLLILYGKQGRIQDAEAIYRKGGSSPEF